jgi:group I intron endonuclease
MNSENKTESEPNDTTKTTVQPSAKNVCCGIYGLRNKTNGKWYVGYSKNIYKRWSKYRTLKCHKQPKIYNALKKYSVDGFYWIVLETLPRASNKSIWGNRETYWINKYDSINAGYNCRTGGDGWSDMPEHVRDKIRKSLLGRKRSQIAIEKTRLKHLGMKRSEATRQKMREAQLGKSPSEETRKKIGDTVRSQMTTERRGLLRSYALGRHCSESTKQHLRQIFTGRKHTPESIEKMRQAKLGKPCSEETKQKIRETKRRKRLSNVLAQNEQSEIAISNKLSG